MSLSKQTIKLKSLLDTVENEVGQFEAGKKASAARARKTLQDVKKSSHELRKSIIEQLNQMKKDKPADVGISKIPNQKEPKKVEKPIKKSTDVVLHSNTNQEEEKPLENDVVLHSNTNRKERKPRARKPKISI